MSEALTQLFADMPADKLKLLGGLLGSPREPIAIIGMACRFPGGVFFLELVIHRRGV